MMPRRRRTLLTLLALLLGALAAALALRPAPEPQRPLRIALNIWPGFAPALLARRDGLFARHGVAVELLLNEEISQSVEQYKNRRVDGFFNVLTDVIKVAETSFPTKVVYVADQSIGGDVIIARPEYDSLVQLRGGVISFETLHSFSHLFVLRALERAGVGELELYFADVPALEVLNALEGQRIDAGHTWEPVTSRALAKGYRILARAGETPGIITDVLAFHTDVVRDRPAAVQAVVEALFAASERLRGASPALLSALAAEMGMTPEELGRGLAGIEIPDRAANRAAFRVTPATDTLHGAGLYIARQLAARGQIAPQFDIRNILEPRFVRKAAAPP